MLSETLKLWREELNANCDTEFFKQYNEADDYNILHKLEGLQEATNNEQISHPQAVYTSRIIEISDIVSSKIDHDCSYDAEDSMNFQIDDHDIDFEDEDEDGI
ncbi:2838_t:CDS:2 [Funneliformis caledonium]|uniref:2838_t:CDS:1 n=1 Tax=Funneliformis caledonium TaxID=1117310 RepID=A0A9N9EJ86_9GLOM|nr:2838_t:CDS:2 [Funneliformis caledonium]